MNRRLAALLLAALALPGFPLFAGTPHTVTGPVRNHDSSVPADGAVTFNAYVAARPGEVQTQGTTGAGYTGGYWYINAGNFATNWSAGDVLHVDFHHTGTGVNASLNFTLTSNDPDIAPTVSFPAPTYSVTFAVSPSGGGTTSPSAGAHTYSAGTAVPITATPAAGYQFVNWTRTGSGTFGDANSASTNFTVSGTATVTANFSIIQRTLTMGVSPSGGGTTTPAEGAHTYDHGTVVTVTAAPSAGYRFVSWTGGVASPSSATTTVTMDANRTVTATFIAVYTLDMGVSPGGSGTTSPAAGSHTYDAGTVVSVNATPATGYQFASWTGDVASPSSASTTVTMNGNKTVTANFSIIQRTLTMGISPSGGGTTTPAEGAHTYDHGTVVTVTAAPSAGYRFVSWTGGVASPSSATTTVTMDANRTVTANFIAVYTLDMVVSPGGSGTTSPAAGSHMYDAGTVVAVNATPATGYQFASWTGDVASPSSASTTVTMNGNKTVTANFGLIRTLNMGVSPAGSGTTDPSAGAHTVADGAVVTVTATPATGYQFASWTGDVASPSSASTTVTMNGNKTVTANFTLIPRTLTMGVSPSGSGTTTPAEGAHTYDHGTVVTVTAAPAAGYLFVNWTGDVASPGSATTTVTMNANKTVTANFALRRTLTMAVNPPGSGTTVPSVGPHDYMDGTVVTITAAAAAGYLFVSWTGDVADPNSATTTVAMTGNKTVTANFEAKSRLTLGVNPAGGGVTNPSAGIHDYPTGTLVTITATAAPGYAFVSWTGDVADPNSASTTVTMNVSKTVTANFIGTERRLTLSADPADAGTTNPVPGTYVYPYGTWVTVTATPAPGHRFLNWTGSVAVPTSPTTTVTMDADRVVIAHFADERILTMAVNPAGGGTTNPSAGTHTVADGEAVSLTATPAPGYRFVNWTGDVADPNSASTTVTMSGNKTVTANFVPGDYTLTLGVIPAGGGTTNPSAGTHSYGHGTVVTLTAAPAAGYLFTGWTGDVADSLALSTTVTIDANKSVTAHFALKRTLTLTVSPAGAGTTDPSEGPHDYADGTVVTLTATPAPGSRFVNWSGDVADPNSASTTVTMNANKTVTANFSVIPGDRTLTLAVSPAGAGTTDPATGAHAYTDGMVVTVTATAAAGYRFLNWTGEVADPNSASTTVTMSADKSVRANFIATRTLTMSANPAEGGTTFPSLGTHVYDSGTVVGIVATAAAGYRFAGWLGDVADPASATTTVSMNGGDRTVTANFTAVRTLTLGASPAGGGTTSPSIGTYTFDAGAVVDIEAIPSTNYRFVSWTGDVADPNSVTTTVTLNSDKTVTANFTLKDAVEDAVGGAAPESFGLSQNYPNPFNPSTRVAFQLPKTAGVLLTVCNSNGQRIRTLLNETRPAGTYEAVWDGRDDSGNSVGSGIYYCQLIAGEFNKTMKMVYVR